MEFYFKLVVFKNVLSSEKNLSVIKSPRVLDRLLARSENVIKYLASLLADFAFANFILRFGWLFFFLLSCFALYEQGLRMRNREFDKLHRHFLHLEQEKKEALVLQEDLLLQINSQSDPEWVELTLKKVLGLVAHDETKIYFGN